MHNLSVEYTATVFFMWKIASRDYTLASTKMWRRAEQNNWNQNTHPKYVLIELHGTGFVRKNLKLSFYKHLISRNRKAKTKICCGVSTITDGPSGAKVPDNWNCLKIYKRNSLRNVGWFQKKCWSVSQMWGKYERESITFFVLKMLVGSKILG